MKTKAYIIVLAAALAGLFAACKKEEASSHVKVQGYEDFRDTLVGTYAGSEWDIKHYVNLVPEITDTIYAGHATITCTKTGPYPSNQVDLHWDDPYSKPMALNLQGTRYIGDFYSNGDRHCTFFKDSLLVEQVYFQGSQSGVWLKSFCKYKKIN